MLKIVEIIPILSIRRGAESFFANLCVTLKNRDDIKLDVVLLYDQIDDSFIKQFDEAGIKPFYCHKHKGLDIKASRHLKKILLELGPDIIHTHNCCFFTYFLAFGYKKMGWKYFHTCHSIPNVEATSLEHFFRRRYARKGLMTNIGISPIVSEEFKKDYKVNNVPYVINGIPIIENVIHRDKKYDFVICASFDDNKNHRLLIDAFELLPNHDEYTLICLGDGPLLNEIKVLVEQKNLANNVLFTGAISNVGDCLAISKVFILPSKNEGIPISILEAMNYGLPIIASRVGGIPDFVSDKNGILFESNNIEELANAMNELITNVKLYGKVSNYNVEYSKNFSIEKCTDRYLSIFKGEYERE